MSSCCFQSTGVAVAQRYDAGLTVDLLQRTNSELQRNRDLVETELADGRQAVDGVQKRRGERLRHPLQRPAQCRIGVPYRAVVGRQRQQHGSRLPDVAVKPVAVRHGAHRLRCRVLLNKNAEGAFQHALRCAVY